MPVDLDALIARVPSRRARVGLELTRDTIRDAAEDRVTGLAAEIAFWVLLSLPPLLLLVAAAAGFVGEAVDSDVKAEVIGRISAVADLVFDQTTVEGTIQPLLDGLLERQSTSVLSFGFLLTLYSASRAVRVIIHALAIAYDLEERRPSWQSRVLGFAYVLAAFPIIVVLVPLVVAGPGLGARLDDLLPVTLGLGPIWRVAFWPASLATVTVLITLLYHRGAPWWTPYRRDVPGAVLATAVGVVASVGLRIYTVRAFGGDSLYAPLAAPLAVLVWLWLQGIALLIGAELNAEIEKRWPQRVDGQGRPLQRLQHRAVVAARGAVASRAAGGRGVGDADRG